MKATVISNARFRKQSNAVAFLTLVNKHTNIVQGLTMHLPAGHLSHPTPSHHFLLVFSERHFGFEVSPNEELQEQKEVTSVHDKGCRVVFFFNPTGNVRLEVVKSNQRHGHTDNHL